MRFPALPQAFALLTLLASAIGLAAESTPPALPSSPPPKSWIDPDTGHRVIRLTDEPNSASLYFNDNGYTPDGKEMIYTTSDGISVLDLKTFQTRSAVKGRVRAIAVGHKTPSVFYLKARDSSAVPATGKPVAMALFSTNLDTGETHKLADLPRRGTIASVNADETLAAGTYIEGDGPDYGADAGGQTHPLDQPTNKGAMMAKRLAARLPLVLFTVDLRTGEVRILLHSTDWINHLLFSPTDPALLMYCHEGAWHQVDRIWTIHTDGTHNTLIHQRTMEMEIAGHEFWGHDGQTIWYDLQTPKGEVFWVAGYNLTTGERTWYHLERNEWSIHFNVSSDRKLFCGDGGDPGQVAKAPDGEWIYLFKPSLIRNDRSLGKDLIRPGLFTSERLVNMSKHHYRLEPNVSFSPDDRLVIFRSNMLGPIYVFGVEVAKADAP